MRTSNRLTPCLDQTKQQTCLRRITATLVVSTACLFFFGSCLQVTSASTTLGLDGTHFTINGRPAFLLGLSYYGALGAPEEFIRLDFEQARELGFNWLRVWATWSAFTNDVSAVDVHGQAREPFLSRLKWLLAECDRRGLVVDVTLTRGPLSGNRPAPAGALPDLAAHECAVNTLVGALKPYLNWYLDLANERDVRDARYVPVAELRTLRELVRRLDPARLVTASGGGHDLDEKELREALLIAGLDFVAPHRPRTPESPSQTEEQTRTTLGLMKQLGRLVPVQYQEPFRRGYEAWQPSADDFLKDLRGAVAGGAAGWCLHNGSQRGAPGNEPRRSFDLRARRLFDQLDSEELKAAAGARNVVDKTLKK